MPVQMMELEEVQMVETSDESLESVVVGGNAYTVPTYICTPVSCS